MTDRVHCTTPGCDRLILPDTAARTGGFCMPCVQETARRQREDYVRSHRRDVDRFVGVTDPVEMLQLLHEPSTHDPLVNLLPPPRSQEDLYVALDARQIARLVAYAGERVEHDDKQLATVLEKAIRGDDGARDPAPSDPVK